jgi:hypothetical protein
MATGSPGTNGVWQYGEDDSEATFSALLNKAASTTDTAIGLDRARLTALEAAGRIIKVVNTNKTDTFSTTSTSLTDVTGLSASITPASTANKVLVTVSIPWGISSSVDTPIFTIADGSNNNLINASSPGGRTPAIIGQYGLISAAMGLASFSFVHSPNTTSSFTYKVRAQAGGGATLHVNRSNADENAVTRSRGIATITLLEIKG